MITGELKSKVDRVWDSFWSGGISNPLEVIEQITYLLFIRRLDDLQTLAEKKARFNNGVIEDPVFLPDHQHLWWSRFKNDDPEDMHALVADEVFPFLRSLGGEGSTYSDHMMDARFTIPPGNLLSRVVDMLDDLPMDGHLDGDLYEYLLSKIASAGVNGQFRTPRHIIELMVAMTAPGPKDEICDPACGTAGFLVAASEYVRDTHPSVLTDAAQRTHFHASMFHGYDFDSTMLRIGSMNMLLHGIESPDIQSGLQAIPSPNQLSRLPRPPRLLSKAPHISRLRRTLLPHAERSGGEDGEVRWVGQHRGGNPPRLRHWSRSVGRARVGCSWDRRFGARCSLR